jgi:hypothetical protein
MKLTTKGAASDELRPTGPREMFEYDFMRCKDCGSIKTKTELAAAMDINGKTPGRFCNCGSNKVLPTNPRWYEFLYPNVIAYGGVWSCLNHSFRTLFGLRWPGDAK